MQRPRVFDIMREFQLISCEHSEKKMFSFNAVAHALRIDKHEDDIDGSEVQQYLDAGDLDKVVFHCRQDCQRELVAARLMMGCPVGGVENFEAAGVEEFEDDFPSSE